MVTILAQLAAGTRTSIACSHAAMHVQLLDRAKGTRRTAETPRHARLAARDDKFEVESDTRLSLRASALVIVGGSLALWAIIIMIALQFAR